MKHKLARLVAWRSASSTTTANEFVDDDDGGPITVLFCPKAARSVLTGPQPVVTKDEFQKSPFYALLGAEWLAYLDGPAHLKRRRQVIQLLRRTHERIDWREYQTKLLVTLRRLFISGGVTDLFGTLAVFSSYQLGRALFGDGYTTELNRHVRAVWSAMNDIADADVHGPAGASYDSAGFNSQALDLRARLNAILPPQSRLGMSRRALLDSHVGLLFASQDTSASAATTAVCLASGEPTTDLGGPALDELIVKALRACPPAPLLYRVIDKRIAVISPYVLRNELANFHTPGGILAASDQLFVFGAGTHRCAGDRMALSEIAAMLGAIRALPGAHVLPDEFPDLEARIVLRPKGVVQIMADAEDEASGSSLSSPLPGHLHPDTGKG